MVDKFKSDGIQCLGKGLTDRMHAVIACEKPRSTCRFLYCTKDVGGKDGN